MGETGLGRAGMEEATAKVEKVSVVRICGCRPILFFCRDRFRTRLAEEAQCERTGRVGVVVPAQDGRV